MSPHDDAQRKANLETMQRTGEDAQPGIALLQQVRQLHSTVGALLPPLIGIADRDWRCA